MLNTVTNVVNNPNICHVEYSVYFLKKLGECFLQTMKYYYNLLIFISKNVLMYEFYKTYKFIKFYKTV